MWNLGNEWLQFDMSSGVHVHSASKVHPVTISLQRGGSCMNSLLDCVSMSDPESQVRNGCSWDGGTDKEPGRQGFDFHSTRPSCSSIAPLCRDSVIPNTFILLSVRRFHIFIKDSLKYKLVFCLIP